ncbi:MAG: hypothetical protein H7Z41_19215 [Cytophagales bacterium]|nr:hypothetical protein [Armatimonadota bacterium]
MGYGYFNTTSSATRARARMASGASAFGYSARAHAGSAPALHPTLDLTRKPRRESRDSADSLHSTPIAVLCDVTGSMSNIPELVINDLHKLMRLILDGKVVPDPQIAFGAIGDANSDSVPFALGEFESDDVKAEAHLANLFLEGGGGGQSCESYELPLWFFGNHVHTDAWEKRREKGFLFIIGDESPYSTVRRAQARKHLGVAPSEDLSLEAAARQAQEKWEVFCIRPGGTSYFADKGVRDSWTKILPSERVIQAADWQQIVPQIAATVSVLAGESLDDTAALMTASGFDRATVGAVTKSLLPLAQTAVPMATGVSGSALVRRISPGALAIPRATRL